MAWIESHQSLSRHRKTLRAAALLKVDRHKLIGHLHQLWWWALDNVPSDGFLNGTMNEEIEGGAEWDGESGTFVDALTRAGFIDALDEGRYIHDWYEFAGKLLVRREDNRKRQERKRVRDRFSSIEDGHAHVTRDSRVTSRTSHGATQPNPTQPNSDSLLPVATQPTGESAPVGASAPAPSASPSQDGAKRAKRSPSADSTATHPSVAVFKQLTAIGPRPGVRVLIEEQVPTDAESQGRWETVITTWLSRQKPPGYVAGMLEWFREGIPPEPRPGGGRPTAGSNGQVSNGVYAPPAAFQRTPEPDYRKPEEYTPEELAASDAERKRIAEEFAARRRAPPNAVAKAH